VFEASYIFSHIIGIMTIVRRDRLVTRLSWVTYECCCGMVGYMHSECCIKCSTVKMDMISVRISGNTDVICWDVWRWKQRSSSWWQRPIHTKRASASKMSGNCTNLHMRTTTTHTQTQICVWLRQREWSGIQMYFYFVFYVRLLYFCLGPTG
jgi:hypothetical protein